LYIFISDASRTLIMDSSFYVGHKQTVLHPNEVLISVLIPLTRKVNMEMQWLLHTKSSGAGLDDIHYCWPTALQASFIMRFIDISLASFYVALHACIHHHLVLCSTSMCMVTSRLNAMTMTWPL